MSRKAPKRRQGSPFTRPPLAVPPSALSADKLRQAEELFRAGRFDEAEICCMSLLKQDRQHTLSMRMLGVIAGQRGHHQKAIDWFSRAIAINPKDATAHYNHTKAVRDSGKLEEVLAGYDEMIRLKPNYAEAWNNRGNVLERMGRLHEALESYERALALDPESAEAWNNRGMVLKDARRPEEAIRCFDQAIVLGPEKLNIYRWNKSLALLLQGNFSQGWFLFESRRKLYNAHYRDFQRPLWQGDRPITNQTLFLYAERELGDVLQFCRYVSLLKARGVGKVIVEAPRPLLRLLASLSDVNILIQQGEEIPPFDLHCPIMSLPLASRTFREEDIPADIPYLFADPGRVAQWSKKLGVKQYLRVGLVWNGGFRPDQPEVWAINERRNIDFSQLAQLNHPEIHFYSLQKGDPAESELLHIKNQYWASDNFHIFTADIGNFADTAALIENLDLVIAVDTSTAHLAAAMGKPVWLLSRFDGCWRWLLERQDSPWYPTMKIYRQPRFGDWEDVLIRVRQDLQGVLNGTVPLLPARVSSPSYKDKSKTSASHKTSDVVLPSLETRFQQALERHQAGQIKEAYAIYQEILAASPDHFDSLHLAGVIACQMGDPAGGLSLIDHAIRLNPSVGSTYYNRGSALHTLQRLEEALASYDQALVFVPGFSGIWTNRARVLSDLKRLEDALSSYDQALALNPQHPESWSERGVVLLGLLRREEAIESFDRALSLNPGFVGAQINKSQAFLMGGDFAWGWPLFEWRWKIEPLLSASASFSNPRWLGKENIADKTILLCAEQGSGDTFQFCRYAALVKASGAKVVMAVPWALRRVLAGLNGVDQWVSVGEPKPHFDLYCPLMSLPLALKTFREEDIPADIPYLFADTELVAQWGRKLGEKKRLRVGLVWNGGLRPEQPELASTNERRNIPFPLIARLNHPDIDFYSLQKGEPAESELLRIREEHWPDDNLHILTPDIQDFADTAALITHLDLVISVDTSILHLAGALGKPVWLLNRFDSCWRWMLGRDDSPWYPTLKIYRQTRYGDWSEVIKRVSADLSVLNFG